MPMCFLTKFVVRFFILDKKIFFQKSSILIWVFISISSMLAGQTPDKILSPVKGTIYSISTTNTGVVGTACPGIMDNTWCGMQWGAETGFLCPGTHWRPGVPIQGCCSNSNNTWCNTLGGVGGADDTYAIDFNQNGNADAGKEVYAVSNGEVVYEFGYTTTRPNGEILIKHTESNGEVWYSSYLHLKDIPVLNKYVEAGTYLGKISSVGPFTIHDHLHFAIYENINGGLISRDREIVENGIQINYGQVINGGKASQPNQFKVYFSIPEHQQDALNNTNLANINNLVIGEGLYAKATKPVVKVQDNLYYFIIDDLPQGVNTPFVDQQFYDIRFKIFGATTLNAYSSNLIKFTGVTPKDNYPNYHTSPYIELGLFHGLFNDIVSGFWGSFVGLKRGEAAREIVKIGLLTGHFSSLNVTVPSGGTYRDISSNNQYFPYIQTLVNRGVFSGNPSADFQPDERIKYGELAYWIVRTFGEYIVSNGNTFQNYNCQNICSGDNPPEWKDAMDILKRTYLGVQFLNSEKFAYENIDIGEVLNTSGNYCTGLVCTMNPTKGEAAKVFVNTFLKIRSARNQNTFSARSNLNDLEWQVAGDKFRLPGSPSNTLPTSPVIFRPENINDNEEWTSNIAEGTNLAYFWAIQGGQLTVLNSDISRIKWMPPKVSQTTTFNLYLWIGNDKGNFSDGILPIIVSPADSGSGECSQPLNLKGTPISNTQINYKWDATSNTNKYSIRIRKDGGIWDLIPDYTGNTYPFTTATPCSTYDFEVKANCGDGSTTAGSIKVVTMPCQTPSQPARNLQVTSTNIFTKFIGLNWERGNGDGVIIVADELGANQQEPVNFSWYNALANFEAAPIVANGASSKVVYRGTGTSTNVINLKNDQSYHFRAYEYFGNDASNVLYSSTPATVTAYLDAELEAIANFDWNPYPIYAGTAIEFSGFGDFIDGGDWVFNGANKVTAQGMTADNVIFTTPGTYEITFNGTSSFTNTSSTITKEVQILDPDNRNPDLIVSSISLSQNPVMQEKSVDVTITVQNIGAENFPFPWTAHYLSTDNVLSNNDYHFSTKNHREEAVISAEGAYTYTVTLEMPDAGDFSNTGSNFLIVSADFPENVSENDETNNDRAQSITIESFLPDIVFKNASISPTTIGSSQQATLTYAIDEDVSNSINMQAVISIDDKFGGNNDLASINFVNQSFFGRNAIQTITIPSHIPDGNYSVIIAADWNNQYQELSESNNLSAALPISVSSPTQPNGDPTNLQITNISDGECNLEWENASNYTLIGVNDDDEVILPCDDYFEVSNADFSQALTICDERRGGRSIYFGNGNSINVNNLPTNRDISVKAFSANVYSNGNRVDYYQNSTDEDESDDFYMFKAVTENEVINNWEHISYENFDFIQPVNNSVIYAADNGRFYKSVDGGKIWNVKKFTSQGINIWCESMYFVSEQVGFIGGQAGDLYKTTDGGNTWQLKHELSGQITRIHFISNTTGFILGGKEVFKTQDGGETWSQIGNFAKSIFDIHCLEQNTIYVSTNRGILYVSFDGGASWETRSCPNSLQFNAVYFSSREEGWLGSTNGKLFKTEDGGLSWDELIINNGASNFILDIKVVNNTVVVFGNSSIFQSFDSGITWQELIGPSSSSNSNYYLDENYFFLLTRGDTYEFNGNVFESDLQISQPSLSQSSFCTGDELNFSFNMSAEANYLIELSDDNGNFSNDAPIIIGQGNGIEHINETGIISSTITSSTNYRIRVVVNSIPKAISSPSNNFSIQTIPITSISNLPNEMTTNDEAIFLNGIPNGGTFKVNDNVVPIFNPSSLGVGIQEVTYEVTQNGCSASTTNHVTVSEGKSIMVTMDNTSICAGFDLGIEVQMDGTFLINESFDIQLSNKNGQFVTPTIMQTFNGKQSGTFVVSLPITLESGNNYKIRIVGENNLISNITQSIVVSAAPSPNILINEGETTFRSGAFVLLSNSYNGGGTNPIINWYRNGNLFATNQKVATIREPEENEVIYTSILSNAQCAKNFEVFSNPVILRKLDANERLNCNGENVNLIDMPNADEYHRSVNTIVSRQNLGKDLIISYKAGETITLNPGFHAPNGSNFIASIDDCQETDIVEYTDSINTISFKKAQEELGTKNISLILLENENSVEVEDLNTIIFRIFPNPFQSQTTIRYHLPRSSNINLQLIDFLGRKIKTIANTEKQEKGWQEIQLSSENLEAGTYYLLLNSGGMLKTQKLLLLR